MKCVQHLVQMHYSGLGHGCSIVIEKELNDRTVPHRRQQRSDSFWFICTIAESPNFAILKLVIPHVAREGPGKAGEEFRLPDRSRCRCG
jgi:hypothetical protein